MLHGFVVVAYANVKDGFNLKSIQSYIFIYLKIPKYNKNPIATFDQKQTSSELCPTSEQ